MDAKTLHHGRLETMQKQKGQGDELGTWRQKP